MPGTAAPAKSIGYRCHFFAASKTSPLQRPRQARQGFVSKACKSAGFSAALQDAAMFRNC
jgi:hypothetical protein